MKRKLFLFVLIIAILSLTFGACTVTVHRNLPENVPEKGTVFMWEVGAREGDGKLYLLGSVHVGYDGLYPLNPTIMNAFEESDILAVECDVVAALQSPDAMMYAEKFMYTDGTTLEDHIPADLYAKAEAALKEKGIPIKLFNTTKPIALSQIILDLYMEEWGYLTDKGIDIYFLELAKKKGMEIAEIESIEFQYDLLGGFSDEIQILDLKMTLDGLNTYKDELDSMFAYWTAGDVESFEELCLQEDDSLTPEEEELAQEYNKKMLDERNYHMADKAEEYLKTGKTTFFVVGSAHMVGETGIVNLLRERGYKVVQK